MKKIFLFLLIFSLTAIPLYWHFFGPVGSSKTIKIFTIPKNQDNFDLVQKLEDGKFIKKNKVLKFYLDTFVFFSDVKSGGYHLSDSMWALDVFKKINGNPDLVWVSFSSCLRKEQIGEILTEALGWTNDELTKWNTIDTIDKPPRNLQVFC